MVPWYHGIIGLDYATRCEVACHGEIRPCSGSDAAVCVFFFVEHKAVRSSNGLLDRFHTSKAKHFNGLDTFDKSANDNFQRYISAICTQNEECGKNMVPYNIATLTCCTRPEAFFFHSPKIARRSLVGESRERFRFNYFAASLFFTELRHIICPELLNMPCTLSWESVSRRCNAKMSGYVMWSVSVLTLESCYLCLTPFLH
jgi:hypothetical protein